MALQVSTIQEYDGNARTDGYCDEHVSFFQQLEHHFGVDHEPKPPLSELNVSTWINHYSTKIDVVMKVVDIWALQLKFKIRKELAL